MPSETARCLLIFGLIGCTGDVLAAQLEPEIQAALKANAEALSGLKIEGHQQRRFLMNPGLGLEEIGTPESEKEFTERVPFVLKLQGPKVYMSLRYPAGQYHSGTATNERSFDGSRLFTGRKDPKGNVFNPGILRIESQQTLMAKFAQRFSRDVPALELPYLSAAGFTGSLLPEDLGRPIQSLVLSQIDVGTLVSSNRTTKNGKQMVEIVVSYPDPWASKRIAKVQSKPSNQPRAIRESMEFQETVEQMHQELFGKVRYSGFMLDPAMNYAVREIREWRESDAPMFHTKCDNFVMVENSDLWLPKRCNITSWAYELRPNYVASRPVYETLIRVDTIDRSKFTDDDFRIWYDYGGSVVSDYTHEKAPINDSFEYTVPVSEDALRGASGDGNLLRWWLIIANVSVIIVVILAMIWRRAGVR